MARFDVFSNPGGHTGTPYVVEVQGNHLSGLATRVVIPLRRLDDGISDGIHKHR
jgi:toxin CcdB